MKKSDILSQISESIHEQHHTNNQKSQSRREILLSRQANRPPINHNNNNNHNGQMDFSKTSKVNMSQALKQQQKDTNFKKSEPIINSTHSFVQNQRQFMVYYQENISLKKKQEELERQVYLLKGQLQEKSQASRAAQQRELMSLASGKKAAWDTKNAQSQLQSRQKSTQKGNDSQKVTNLLEIIDSYKAKLLNAEEQIANLKRQKTILQQDVKLKDRKNQKISQERKDSQPNQIFQFKQQLQSTLHQLQLEKQRNKYNEADIKRLQNKIKVLQLREQQFDGLKSENRNLQQKLLRMTQLPSFNHVTDKVDEQRRAKQAEQKCKSLMEKINVFKNQKMKSDAQIKILNDQLIKVNFEADTLEKQNQRLKKFSFQNPILQKLARDPDLLGQVVYEIQNGKRKNQDYQQLQRQTYEKILMQKQALANQLTTIRAKMSALQQNWKQRERVSKIQKQQLMSTFKQQANSTFQSANRMVSKNGVAYTDDISTFSQDAVNIPNGSNYFDLFIGQLNLLDSMLSNNFSIRNTQNILTLVTVDFYNHNTETTRPVHGANCNMQSQFSFKVNQDQFFFKYLNKGSFTMEVWGSEGNQRINFGKVSVDLKPLVMKSKKNMAPVCSMSAPVYKNQKVMGSINFIMRMRVPIYDQMQRLTQIEQFTNAQQSQTRRLIIQIQEGRGFPQNSNTFVYFPFRLEDYYTKTYKGSTPTWNYHKTIQLQYNNDVKNYLRKNQLQLIVMDDNAVIVGEGDSDVLGTAFVSLTPLLQNQVIKERVSVGKGTQKIGQIDVRIYWSNLQEQSSKIVSSKGSNGGAGVEGLKGEISQYMKSRRIDADYLFKEIDRNHTNMISFQEFYTWVLKAISKRYSQETVSEFYREFNEPVNIINFSARLNANANIHSEEIAKQFGKINKLFEQNTEMIKKKVSLQQFLKGKQIDTVSLDIDSSRDGKISRKQLISYLDAHNVQTTGINMQNQIQLVKFIKKYQSMT